MVPTDVVKSKCARYLLHGNPIHRAELIHDSVFSIMAHYQQEFRLIVEYYRLAFNLHQLNRLKWVMERSLVQTLAHKLRISVSIYRRYQTTLSTPNGPRAGLQVTVERGEGQKPLVAHWGGISLSRNMKAVLNDSPLRIVGPRAELERRLLANTCELCGSKDDVQVHHVRALYGFTTQREKHTALLGSNYGCTSAQDTSCVPTMPHGYSCWKCHAKNPHEYGNTLSAGYSEKRKPGSERGGKNCTNILATRWSPTHLSGVLRN